MPSIKRPAVDFPDNEGPPTALQDVVNVALLVVACAVVGLGASQAAGWFSPAPLAEVRAAGEPRADRPEARPRPARAPAERRGVVIGQEWPRPAPAAEPLGVSAAPGLEGWRRDGGPVSDSPAGRL